MTFGELEIGDLFNTKPARWVKISTTEAICVMGASVEIGDVCKFPEDYNVIVLWSSNPKFGIQ